MLSSVTLCSSHSDWMLQELKVSEWKTTDAVWLRNLRTLPFAILHLPLNTVFPSQAPTARGLKQPPPV